MMIYHPSLSNTVKDLQEKGWQNMLIQKYVDYAQKRKRAAETGRTSNSDSTRGKTYKAEWAFQAKHKYDIVDFNNLKEANRFMNKVLKSKLWLDLCGGKDRKIPTLELNSFRGRTAGRAYGWKIQLCARNGLDAYTLLHEMAHCAGHMHHDVSFRLCLLKLVSRFIGPDAAKSLKECFKEQGLRMTMVTDNIKDPEAWLKTYQRLESARKKL